jgi:competence protein ComEA
VSFDHDPHSSHHDVVDRPPPRRGWSSTVLDHVRPWVEWFGLGRVVAAAVTIVALVVGGWWLLQTPAAPTEAGLPFATTTTAGSAPTSTATASTTAPVPTLVVVHVAGAVARPGVYEVRGDARVHAAIDAAGGALPDAAPGSLNLAAPLTDGERIYVPVVGEDVPPPAAPAPTASTPAGPVDLNRATATELDGLPGIGPATAQAIVDHRTANGPFAAVDDLEAVRGIGPAKLEAIRQLVTV